MEYKTIPFTQSAFSLFLSLAEREHAFFLDSSLLMEEIGGLSIIAVEPFLTLRSKNGCITLRWRDGREETYAGDPFAEMKKLLAQYHRPKVPGILFAGGAIGYFAYDLYPYVDGQKQRAVDDAELPDCFFAFYDGAYVIDHQAGTLQMAAWGLQRSAAAVVADMVCHVQNLAGSEVAYPVPAEREHPRSFTANMTKEEYLQAIRRIKEYICAGDVYQVNFTQRFACHYEDSPLALYQTLRTLNPAPFAAYLDTGEGVVLSSSPERFLLLREGVLETRPIKGTRPRGTRPEDDAAQADALLRSEKDRAEHVMIVDLERNDLNRVAAKGSVQVPSLLHIESYATVHHLVSTVQATVRPECDAIDCIMAAFPGGSITGAPKRRALDIIDELEPTSRNVYTGSVGYISFAGEMDFNIAIRTIVVKNETAYVQVGGGIVWDSDPEQEYAESLLKARALLQALGGKLDADLV